MNTDDIDTLLANLRSVQTMPALDAMRRDVAAVMLSEDDVVFHRVQGAFRKAKNRLKRIPLRDRNW